VDTKERIPFIYSYESLEGFSLFLLEVEESNRCEVVAATCVELRSEGSG